MHRYPRILARALFSLLCLLPCLASAQTLTINNSIQTYPTLTSTTVTMTGRSELRITGAGTPISGCTIHLNSPDSWLILTSLKPLAVNTATYLSQIKVSGAAAALNTNCRIVQYGAGAVVIPHSASFAPLQVFTGKYFTGSAMSLTQYTAYNDANLGAFANQISSFRLKRGYTATIAQNSAGTGMSKNYVAQDGDIEVAVLPADLENSVSFVRVFPWRWVTKKGSCDIDPTALNAAWHYNWDINKNSTLDWEYAAIKQQPNWPSLSQNWATRGINHLLGFNEPNNPVEDAYENLTPVGSASNAAARWPELLGTGLRVGGPAVTDGGYSWIVDFISHADAAGYRVDYVPVHYYRSYANNDNPQGAANSLYAFLKSIHDATGRPIWLTEFNNGANWTDNAHDPTAAQNRNVVEAMMKMMDDTPWVERYSIYSRVEWFRQTHYDDGAITPMGAMYRDHVAPLAYQQDIPELPTPAGALYRFENDARDSSANAHAAITKGAATFSAGKTGQSVAMSGDATSGDHVQLSSRLGDSVDFTFGAWVYWTGGAGWQRIFDLGAGTNNHLFLTPSNGSVLRFTIKDGGAEQQLNHNAALPTNTWVHVAVTIGGNTGKLFVNGALVVTNTSMTLNPADVGTTNNFLGRSQFSADPYFAGRLDDVQFLPYALPDAKVASMMTNAPPSFTSSTISGGNATQGVAYTGSIAGKATDSDTGDTLSYSKIDGPAWLTVAPSGALSGTPTFDDSGVQEFTVMVADAAGASAAAQLTITLPAVSGNGTWVSAGSGGTWSDAVKWSNSFPANGEGNTANFGTVNILSDLTVTLDRSRSIGSLVFGDTSGAQSWTLNNSGGATLTLDAAAPTITVNQSTATIAAPLAGTAGLTKSGAGTLILSGDNSLSGTLYVDTSATSGSSGVLRITNPDAVADIGSISIRNNNSGSSTLELDGTARGITAAAPIALSGRNVAVPAIRSLAGANTLSGGVTLNGGGSNYIFQSDAGVLTLAGTITSSTGGSRTATFQGNDSFHVSGAILDGTSTVLPITKSGSGTLTLSNANNTFSGNVVVSGGIVVATAPAPFNVTNATKGPLGNPLTAARTITVQSGATLVIAIGNVFGSGGQSTAPAVSLIINQGGTVKTAASSPPTAGAGAGDANIFGPITLNGGTLSTGNGFSSAWQSAILTGPVTAAGSTASVIETHAANTAANGLSLGKAGGGTIAFDVGAAGLVVSAPLANAANNSTGGLSKTGVGALTLNGTNTYTGVTNVTAGTLAVDGSIASGGTLTAANGATLAGAGTINAGATINGTHRPGAAIGTQTFGALSYGSTARLSWELGSNSVSAGAFDKVTASGPVTITSGAAVEVSLAPVGGSVALNDAFWTQPRSWAILTGSSISGTFALGNVSADPGGRMVSNYGVFALQQNATTVTLNFTPHSPQQSWRRQNFAASEWNNDAISGDTADPDGDGISNLLERAFGGNPKLGEKNLLPAVDQSGPHFSITYRRSKAATDLAYTVQESLDLSPDSWTPAVGTASILTDDGSVQVMRFTVPAGNDTKKFLRLGF